MLTDRELKELMQSLARTKVLSVYIDGGGSDESLRATWRQTLAQNVATVRWSLARASHDEREMFERCVEMLYAELSAKAGALGADAWMAFITIDGVVMAGELTVPVSSIVTWDEGPRVAPYVRALKHHRAAVVAIVDSRRARLFVYREGKLEVGDTIRAHAHIGPVMHSRGKRRALGHSRIHGAIGRDEAERGRREGHERLLRELVDRVETLAGADGWIILGGIPHVAQNAARLFPAALASRMLVSTELSVRATPDAIRTGADHGARQLRRAADAETVVAMVDGAFATGHALPGPQLVLEALAGGRVGAVYFTGQLLADNPEAAEAVVRRALEQRASVEFVSGDGARWLDTECDGVAAALRFARRNGTTG